MKPSISVDYDNYDLLGTFYVFDFVLHFCPPHTNSSDPYSKLIMVFYANF